MPITVKSPYSGHPVKIRDQDLGRAVRDEAGRVFYVVPRAEGGGYYSAPTRKGSPKDEERYDQLEAQEAAAHESSPTPPPAAHDATGGRPPGAARRRLARLVLAAAVAAAAYAGYTKWNTGHWPGLAPGPTDTAGPTAPAIETP